MHDLRTLWHFLPVWDDPPGEPAFVNERLQLFYVVAMRGWTVAARHTVDPDALALLWPLPDPLPESRPVERARARTNRPAKKGNPKYGGKAAPPDT